MTREERRDVTSKQWAGINVQTITITAKSVAVYSDVVDNNSAGRQCLELGTSKKDRQEETSARPSDERGGGGGGGSSSIDRSIPTTHRLFETAFSTQGGLSMRFNGHDVYARKQQAVSELPHHLGVERLTPHDQHHDLFSGKISKAKKPTNENFHQPGKYDSVFDSVAQSARACCFELASVVATPNFISSWSSALSIMGNRTF
uniref:Uncharacterized protein n=1 Tax=Vespula pensylvanica TaxID=30213 RepID=A0A834NQ66_VESPE|nr:hypothetical protein H0235_012098 [Vespula pensylvanica]